MVLTESWDGPKDFLQQSKGYLNVLEKVWGRGEEEEDEHLSAESVFPGKRRS